MSAAVLAIVVALAAGVGPTAGASGSGSPSPATAAVAHRAPGAIGTPAAGSQSTAPAVAPHDADPTEQWVQANGAYRAGRFGEAVAGYEALLAAGIDDGEVYYNLGNASLRAGDLAQAIAAYRAAERRLPRSEDLEANLRFARGRVSDAVAPPEPSVAARTLLFWHYSLSPGELVAAALGASVGFWLALTLAVVRRRRRWRRVAIALAPFAVALVASAAIRVLSPTPVAVVSSAALPVYSGPGESNVVRFRLHTGAEARVTGTEEGWVRIRLAGGMQGWVPAGSVLVVDT